MKVCDIIRQLRSTESRSKSKLLAEAAYMLEKLYRMAFIWADLCKDCAHYTPMCGDVKDIDCMHCNRDCPCNKCWGENFELERDEKNDTTKG